VRLAFLATATAANANKRIEFVAAGAAAK
jgi:hypothetical protein